jgi:hypothetical protein
MTKGFYKRGMTQILKFVMGSQARQSRHMQGVHVLATRLPRRCAPRNDMIIICNNMVLLAGYF